DRAPAPGLPRGPRGDRGPEPEQSRLEVRPRPSRPPPMTRPDSHPRLTPMSIDPDAFERSRAAVAVSCLRWLQCTGPAIGPERAPARDRVPDRLRDEPLVRLIQVPEPATSPKHPLWDRWLDG